VDVFFLGHGVLLYFKLTGYRHLANSSWRAARTCSELEFSSVQFSLFSARNDNDDDKEEVVTYLSADWTIAANSASVRF